ncbi:MAG: hypothetical protein M1832_000893 [Thelocarpon impressellum]|nr:MAG: hypothetical protein M1832_000893 [Thelocarpon impressellum]
MHFSYGPDASDRNPLLTAGASPSAVGRYVDGLTPHPGCDLAGRETVAAYRSAVERLALLSSGSGASSSSRSPLHMNLGFLRSLTEKKPARDGQQPKRRGPKPDSKPALTRRQELNRQAQRTHRERKELYVKALEQEVLRLKEVVGATEHEKKAIAEENARLKALLRQHGIACPGDAALGNSDFGDDFSQSMSMSMGVSPGPPAASFPPLADDRPLPPTPLALDYDQIGIDFVLTLERPCMGHMQSLLLTAQESEADVVGGHALMASCPPPSHLAESPELAWTSEAAAVDLRRPELATLMDLSHRLQLDGEITPVMAWAAIYVHPRRAELTARDFEILKGDLLGKVRCYGFGAVVEEFELRDALSHVFATKIESYDAFV